MADEEKLIEEFSTISGFDAQRSRFYLESAAWNLKTALESLYDEDDEVEVLPQTKAAKAEKPRITMKDSDSSDDEGQTFYAGGSEHSGQQVIGPSKKKKDVVSMLFKSAKEHGAEVVESTDKKGTQKLNFGGTGYKLGETEDDHEEVKPPQSSERNTEPRDVALCMWRTGFTVDDGQLRDYHDPANQEFIDAIKRGQVPMELIREARGGEVYISMEDRRQQDYKPPKAQKAAFSGSGHTLGSPAPSVLGQVIDTGTPGGSAVRPPSASTPMPRAACSTATTSAEEDAKTELAIDTSQPTTNIQVRLPDGSRLVARLNHTHSIGELRRYICTSRPLLSGAPFALMTTFPYATLSDDAKSLKDADLLASTVVVKNV